MEPFSMDSLAVAGGPDPRAWPVTGRIDQVDAGGGTWALRQTRQHFWPAIADAAAYVDATVWIIVRNGAQWVAYAVANMRPAAQVMPFPYAAPGPAWFVDVNGQPVQPLASWAPKPGEVFGVFVSTVARGPAGQAAAVRERTDAVFMAWPANGDGPTIAIVNREGDAAIAPPAPPAAPAAVPAQAPLPAAPVAPGAAIDPAKVVDTMGRVATVLEALEPLVRDLLEFAQKHPLHFPSKG